MITLILSATLAAATPAITPATPAPMPPMAGMDAKKPAKKCCCDEDKAPDAAAAPHSH